VHHHHPGFARGFQDRGDRGDGAGELRHVVAERLAEAAGLHEIALHVDDDERCRAPVDRDRAGFCKDRRCMQ
jgi:hypothetical protein